MRLIFSNALRQVGAVLLALLAGISVPLLIWVAIAVACRDLFVEWRIIRSGLLAGNLTCSLNIDCPPGYQCFNGKCLPIVSS